MVDINKIRINNYITVVSEYAFIECCQIKLLSESFVIIDQLHPVVKFYMIFFISINHDRLDQLGFSRKSIQGITMFSKGGNLIRYINNEYELILGKWMNIKITYVHELQNLWIDLTCEHLSFNQIRQIT